MPKAKYPPIVAEEVVGYWTVVNGPTSIMRPSGGRAPYWYCRCRCGKERFIAASNIKAMRANPVKLSYHLSCGCVRNILANLEKRVAY